MTHSLIIKEEKEDIIALCVIPPQQRGKKSLIFFDIFKKRFIFINRKLKTIKKMENNIITKTTLAERWSTALIKKFAPKPVKEKKNVYGGTTFYYSLSDIEEIEKREDFKMALDKTLKRKENAKKSEETQMKNKRDLLLGQLIIEEFPPKEILIKWAVQHYNEVNRNDNIACGNESFPFILRITQNFVRHCMTNYDVILDFLCHGKYKGDAYMELRDVINSKVKDYLETA